MRSSMRFAHGAKAKGIKVFTVGFDLNSPRALAELQKCATGPENFFDAKTGAAVEESLQGHRQKAEHAAGGELIAAHYRWT